MTKNKKAKNHKRISSPKTTLCNFGFALTPRCGAFCVKFDLNKTPKLRQLISDGDIPPYCYKFTDEDTVIVDQCLVCHINQGYTPEEYERKNEAFGVTRENYKQIEEAYPLVQNEVEQKIRDDRANLIKQGLPVDMDLKKNIRDS